MVTYVIGDIHGNYIGLVDVLKKCNFNKKKDTLISLGDVCDGGCKARQCIDILLGIEHLINILGNHDTWALHWMKTGEELPVWWHQGGMRTAESYDFKIKNVPESHIKFLSDMIPYYIDEKNRIFVHGGFMPFKPVVEQSAEILTWDRDLMCSYAPQMEIPGYKHVFVGHTTTQHFGKDYKIPDCMVPLTFHNLTAMDTGGGWNGRLSIMDVDTFKYYQSDKNANLQNTMKRMDGLKF